MTNILDFDQDPLRTIRGGRFRTFRFPAFIGRGVGDLLAPSLPADEPAPAAGFRDVFADDRFGDDDGGQDGIDTADTGVSFGPGGFGRETSALNPEEMTIEEIEEEIRDFQRRQLSPFGVERVIDKVIPGVLSPIPGFPGFMDRGRFEQNIKAGLALGSQLARDVNNMAGATGFAGPGFDPSGFDPGANRFGAGNPDDVGMEGASPGFDPGLGGSAGDFEGVGFGGPEGTTPDPGQDPEGGFGDEETGGGVGDPGADDPGTGGGGFGGPDDEGIGDDDDEESGGGESAGAGADDSEEDEDPGADTSGDGEDGGEDESGDEEDDGDADADDDPDFHQGGLVTGPDPSRIGEDVDVTAQEGEFVLPRETVDRVGPSRLREVIAGGGGGSPDASFTNEVAGGSRFNPVPGAGQDSAFTSPAIQGPEIPGQNGEARIQGAANPNSGLTAPEQAELMVALTPRVMELMARVFDARGQDFPFGAAPGQTAGVPFKGMPPPQGPAVSGLRGVSA